MKKNIIFCLLFLSFEVCSQITFHDDSDLLYNIKYLFSSQKIRYDGSIAIGITDMNYDNKDDVVIFNNEDCKEMSIVILYQGPYRTKYGIFNFFTKKHHFKHTKPFPSIKNVKAVSISDTNDNGELQIFAGGAYKGLTLYNPIQITSQAIEYPALSTHSVFFWLQGTNFIDIDGDNDLDLFASNDVHMSDVLYNNNGTFSKDFSILKPVAGNPICNSVYTDHSNAFLDPNSGNYGSVFADIDFDINSLSTNSPELYISKCRGGVNANIPMGCLTNQLFKKNATTGQFEDVAQNYSLDDSNQSYAADFGDIDNDGDLDLAIINHSGTKVRILINQYPSNSFMDITSTAIIDNITTNGSTQVIFEDFDNDGYLDLLISNEYTARLYYNNKDLTFSNLTSWLKPTIRPIFSPLNTYETHNGYESFNSCATGDLDNDGYVDIYTDYKNKEDIIWINQGSGNNYLKIRLKGKGVPNDSNKEGIGARLHLEHSVLNTQVREVRAGESYGIVCSFIQNFGLSNYNLTDFILKVYWPSGQLDIIPGGSLIMNDINIIVEN